MTKSLFNITATADRHQVVANEPGGELNCRIQLEPDIALEFCDENATNANICLLVDCSGSMIGRKFEAALSTAKMIIDILHHRHLISLIAFHVRANIVFQNAVPSDANKESLKEQVEELWHYLGGFTDMASGLKMAQDGFAKANADSNIILIISDGEPSSVEDAQEQAEIASGKGVQIHAVGIGDSYKADQLLTMVTPSNGSVYGDSDVENMDDIFRELISRIDNIVATNVRLEVDFDPRAELAGLVRLRPIYARLDLATLNHRDHQLNLQIGNIEGDNFYHFLLQFELGVFPPGRIRLLTARLTYDIYSQDQLVSENLETELVVTFDEVPDEDFLDHNPFDDIAGANTVGALSEEILEAWAVSDFDAAAKAQRSLQELSDRQGDDKLSQCLDQIGKRLENGKRISARDRNDLTVAASNHQLLSDKPEPPPKKVATEVVEVEDLEVEDLVIDEWPKFDDVEIEEVQVEVQPPPKITRPISYDLILIDSGENPILLMREIREATEMELYQIADVMRSTNSTLITFSDRDAAESLKEKLESVGARAAIRAAA